MFGLSRLVAMAIVFFMGFGLAVGLFVGIPAAVVASYSVRDFENNNIVNIPDEKYFDLSVAEKDLLDFNGIELYYEIKELQSFGDDLTMRRLEKRYGIMFDPKLDKFLTDEAMDLPLHRLLSMEGVHAVLQNVYIGDIEGYTCLNEDGSAGGDPSVDGSYWVHNDVQDGIEVQRRIGGLEEVVADFNLDDFISGNINTDNLLHGDKALKLADILGYTHDEEKDIWYDAGGNKVTGIMSVFADCTLDTVDDEINYAEIGALMSYEKVYTGEFDEDGKEIFYWATLNTETNELKPVTGVMKAVAGRTIQTLGGLYDDLTVGDLVPEEQRTGLFSIISAETKLDGIAADINKKVKESPLQFYMNEELITFAEREDMLDGICEANNYYEYFYTTDDDFETMRSYYEFKGNVLWEQVDETTYRIQEWRAKPLNESFSYITKLMEDYFKSLIPTP